MTNIVRIEHYGPKRTRLYYPCQRPKSSEDWVPDRECQILLKPWPINTNTWDWDGNEAAPTLTPSIHCTACGWHGFITKGEITNA